MKQPTKYFILSYIVVIMLGMSCSKKFDEHYNPVARVDKNIVETLEEDPELVDFVKVIDKLGLRQTLGEAAIYTCLAPTNEHVQTFAESKGFQTIDEVPESILRQYVNAHFINGMYYKYDIEKRYRNAPEGSLAATKATYYTTRAEGVLVKPKSIRLFTQPFFDMQADDYNIIYHMDGSGFMVESVRVHETKYDISAANGVIHVLTSPLPELPITDAAVASVDDMSIFSKWLEGHVSYILGPKDQFGWVDTTLIRAYTSIRNVADESVLSTVFAPTDEALLAYFTPYAAHFGGTPGTLDSVPEFVRTQVVRTTLLAEPWFKSDIVRDNPKIRIGGFPQEVSKIAPTIVGSVLSSNSVIYKVNKVVESPILHSVEGGIYMREKFYTQWVEMLKRTNLEDGLTDGLYYQHADKTILVQSDEFWTGPAAEDLAAEDREIRRRECRTGIFNIDVRKDGGFRKRYYPTEFGWILFDNNEFIDYTGNSVSLLSPEPVWEKGNGAIFEVDGFLTPMDPADLDRTVFVLITGDPDYTQFASAIQKAGLESELNLTGFFTYTVFAPTNTAMQAAGIDVVNSTPEQMRAFVGKYIIPNRYVFTDGVTQGGLIPNKNGEMMSFSGSWDTFSVTYAQKTIKPTPLTAANVQGSNGVVHKVNETF
ncbi:fasciclin domain-containing protein [Sphingobacterium sp. SGG-5]|uniref:fasciclin domain-containing protein n=1 Tax=Sphingobacterium sp. SGG-5 TaxID=2710881 RepID=UPI0013EC2A33|nr:fasciclin domain-containing protein [Sphingobacterium sp. SGG-5]NGM61209.1 fasciclin domain-containing protein [Sphingobacterium sp. SGG-5]